jgi:ribosomal protein S18 acetylase RimI-like enzyme
MSRLFVSTDQNLIDFAWLHRTLEAEYWGWAYTKEKVQENAANALSFGIYERLDPSGTVNQLGFARVITDKVSFSFICDVVVDNGRRGEGIGTKLMDCILAHPDVKKTITILGTKQAWLFYEKFGFHAPAQPMMQRDPIK